MNVRKLICLAGSWLALSAPAISRADEPKPADLPKRAELRQELKNLGPEERRAKLKELREKYNSSRGAARPETFARLTAKERAVRLKEAGINLKELKELSPAERRARLRETAEKHLADLQKKKADNSITPEEEKQLTRMVELEKRLEPRRAKAAGKAKSNADESGKLENK